jgi:hypothetical protein
MRIAVPVDADPVELDALLEGLFSLNCYIMSMRPHPPLYRSGIRYRREARGHEEWQSASRLVKRGVGDCEDLASYRAAELAVTGEDPDARPRVKHTSRAGQLHCVVVRGDGTIEDPSRICIALERRQRAA